MSGIACGISDGLGFGFNARAALMTRGLDELSRLAVKCGANPLTLAGLSGVGDLILTCTGDLSRNPEKVGVECHIIEGIYKVIHEGADPLEIVASNMSRPLKPEVSPIISEAYLHH
eukprot:jgi/Picre1/28388/NNA_003793.t1